MRPHSKRVEFGGERQPVASSGSLAALGSTKPPLSSARLVKLWVMTAGHMQIRCPWEGLLGMGISSGFSSVSHDAQRGYASCSAALAGEAEENGQLSSLPALAYSVLSRRYAPLQHFGGRLASYRAP